MLKSVDSKKITYVGWTNNLNKRLKKHNAGNGAKFTRGRKWNLVYYETYKTKYDALKREYFLKIYSNNYYHKFILGR